MKRECWARSIGGCGGGMSREHIISASQFGGAKGIDIQGLPWCKEKKTVGLAGLTAKNLCRQHNSALSPADREAARLKNTLRDFTQNRLTSRILIEGRLVEQWLLKTIVNLHLVGNASSLDVTDTLVRIAFGQEVPARGKGLFIAAEIGEKIPLADGRLSFEHWNNAASKKIGLGVMVFHGWRLLYAFDGAPPVNGAMRFYSANRGNFGIDMSWEPPHAADDRRMQPTFDPVTGRLNN